MVKPVLTKAFSTASQDNPPCACHVVTMPVHPVKDFAIGLKENLREEDNLSTKDKWPIPNVSFVW